MSNENTTPNINVEIVSVPSVKDMNITPVGQNMFSIDFNMIAVIRFASSDIAISTPVVRACSPAVPTTTADAEQLKYADGGTPQPGGETAAFTDFTKQHAYPPQSREILVEWVKLQQGGA